MNNQDIDYSTRDTKAKVFKLEGNKLEGDPCNIRVFKSEELIKDQTFDTFNDFLHFAREHKLGWKVVQVEDPEYWAHLLPNG